MTSNINKNVFFEFVRYVANQITSFFQKVRVFMVEKPKESLFVMLAIMGISTLLYIYIAYLQLDRKDEMPNPGQVLKDTGLIEQASDIINDFKKLSNMKTMNEEIFQMDSSNVDTVKLRQYIEKILNE
jgi:hypothetical protein